jgi:hypothetical protein
LTISLDSPLAFTAPFAVVLARRLRDTTQQLASATNLRKAEKPDNTTRDDADYTRIEHQFSF